MVNNAFHCWQIPSVCTEEKKGKKKKENARTQETHRKEEDAHRPACTRLVQHRSTGHSCERGEKKEKEIEGEREEG